MLTENLVKRTINARRAAHLILSQHEASSSRIVLLEDLAKELSGAPVDVQDYFRESIECVERRLYRAGIVMAWAGYFNVFSQRLFFNHELEIRKARQKWSFKDLADLKEQASESQLLDVAKDVKFIGKAVLRVRQGQLSQRNQCAHPTLYRPNMNVAIGYVDEMIKETLNYVKHA